MRLILVGMLVLVFLVALREINERESTALRIASRLASIQTQIVAADPDENSYYATDYRVAELTYWSKIPHWLVEDAEVRRFVDPKASIKILDVGCTETPARR